MLYLDGVYAANSDGSTGFLASLRLYTLQLFPVCLGHIPRTTQWLAGKANAVAF
jgi:hypothetical protein